MRIKLFVILIVIAAAMTFSAACTDTDSGQQQTPASSTAQPASGTESTTTATPSTNMITGPTEQPEKKYQTDVQVNKDEVYGTITAIYRGGLGQNFITSIVVDVYYPDGTHESKELETSVGDKVEFKGNQNLQDRVKVTVDYMGSIGTYVIYDSLIPKRLAIPNP